MTHSIIIPTLNNSDDTIKCFKSIVRHTRDYQIIWVDDGSEAEHIRAVENFLTDAQIPHQSLKNDHNEGFIASANKGLQAAIEAHTPYIVLQNNDTIVYDGWLEEMTEILAKHENIGAVGPLSTVSVQSPEYLNRFYTDFPREIMHKYRTRKSGEQLAADLQENYYGAFLYTYERLAFFSVVFRTEVVEEVGLLDPAYGTGYYDDDDYCERLLRAGWNLGIAQGAFVDHHEAKSFSAVHGATQWPEEKQKLYARNKEIFERKFSYGAYQKNSVQIADMRELQIRLEKEKKDVQKTRYTLHEMEQSAFWKMRSVYMRAKSYFTK